VLGGLAVEGVDLTRLGSRKARRLLARLALARGAPVSVDALIDTVWGDDPPSQPAEQLSVLISRLRSAMQTALPRTAAGYALDAGWLDVAALAELVAEAQARLRSGAAAPARAAAQAALDLLRGRSCRTRRTPRGWPPSGPRSPVTRRRPGCSRPRRRSWSGTRGRLRGWPTRRYRWSASTRPRCAC
jgi:hypothetical protein